MSSDNRFDIPVATHYGAGMRPIDVTPIALEAALEVRGYKAGEGDSLTRSVTHYLSIGSVRNTFTATILAEGRLRIGFEREVDIEFRGYRSTGKRSGRLGEINKAFDEADAILRTAKRYEAMSKELDLLLGG